MAESGNIQQALARALATLLRPLVRVLLRNGLSYGVFAELARKVFVEVAFEEFAEPGRKQTISRVAALTGLTRKEVKRLTEIDEAGDEAAHRRFNRAIRVLSGWTTDQRFCDSRGRPYSLALEGKNSFAELVKDFSGDVPTRAMLSVLRSAECVQLIGTHVKLIKRAYVPAGDPVEKIRILGADSAELIATIEHNLRSPDDELRFQRKVFYSSVPDAVAREFQALAARKGQLLLEQLNTWLAEHEHAPGADGARRKSVSLGIYYFEDDVAETRE